MPELHDEALAGMAESRSDTDVFEMTLADARTSLEDAAKSGQLCRTSWLVKAL